MVCLLRDYRLVTFLEGEDILADLYVQGAAVIAGVILLLNIWSGKRSGYALNPRKEMQDVRRCMELLRISERR